MPSLFQVNKDTFHTRTLNKKKLGPLKKRKYLGKAFLDTVVFGKIYKKYEDKLSIHNEIRDNWLNKIWGTNKKNNKKK